jgi:hypothetical protein
MLHEPCHAFLSHIRLQARGISLAQIREVGVTYWLEQAEAATRDLA